MILPTKARWEEQNGRSYAYICGELPVELREVSKSSLKPAFRITADKRHPVDVFFYDGKLWREPRLPSRSDISYVEKALGETVKTPLDYMRLWLQACAPFYRSDYERIFKDRDTTKAGVIKDIEAYAGNYLVSEGVLYQMTAEPRYVVQTYGLGGGYGTELQVTEFYNGNIHKERYFSALDGDRAVAFANQIAKARGDIKCVGTFRKTIEVLMPEIVRVCPEVQHGSGDDFAEAAEHHIQNANRETPNPGCAELLCTMHLFTGMLNRPGSICRDRNGLDMLTSFLRPKAE